jgi:glucose-1-phosphate cytidylyltransferase
MKVVILAGGRGSRISEESKYRPKPMVKIGNKPIIWHIIKYYKSFGFREFIICAGYKKKELLNFFSKNNDLKCKIEVVDTGIDTMTGGRIKKIKKYIGNDENFFLTYGDGLSNVDINKVYKLHLKKKRTVTLCAVKTNSKFGVIRFSKKNNQNVLSFKEKPHDTFINGGFFVISKNVFKYIKNSKSIFEFDCLTKLSELNEVAGYRHSGFWHCLDTMRDKEDLNILWKTKPLWKRW